MKNPIPDYGLNIILLAPALIRAVFRTKKRPITVKIYGFGKLVFSIISSIFRISTDIDKEDIYFSIEFGIDEKSFILRELKGTPLGNEIFGEYQNNYNEIAHCNNPFKNQFDSLSNSNGYVLEWDNHINHRLKCTKYHENGEFKYSFIMYVAVQIDNNKSTIFVLWDTIKMLLPLTPLPMCRRVLFISNIVLKPSKINS